MRREEWEERMRRELRRQMAFEHEMRHDDKAEFNRCLQGQRQLKTVIYIGIHVLKGNQAQDVVVLASDLKVKFRLAINRRISTLALASAVETIPKDGYDPTMFAIFRSRTYDLEDKTPEQKLRMRTAKVMKRCIADMNWDVVVAEGIDAPARLHGRNIPTYLWAICLFPIKHNRITAFKNTPHRHVIPAEERDAYDSS